MPFVQFDLLGGIFMQFAGIDPTWFLKFDTELDMRFTDEWGP